MSSPDTGETVIVDNPATMPPIGEIEMVKEPFITAQIITPTEYIGNIMKICTERRGVYKNTTYIDPTRADLRYELPLAEVIFDFYDKLKSTSRGYASLDYEFLEYRESDLVKLDILVEWRAGRCAFDDCSSRESVRVGQETVRKTAEDHPPAALRGCGPGRDRQQGHRAKHDISLEKKCYCEMLRWRHLAKTKIARETKRGEKAYETGRARGNPARGVPGRPLDGGLSAAGARCGGMKSSANDLCYRIRMVVLLSHF